MLLKFAVWWLSRQLKKDPGLWHTYQANLAMSFFDVIRNAKILHIATDKLLLISNEAANNFLKLWTK